MPFKKFKKLFVSTSDLEEPVNLLRVINNIQSNIEDSLSSLIAKTQNDSAIIINQRLVAGQNNVINHTLSRNLVGWKLVRVRGQANVWDTQDDNPATNLTLWLRTSANVTVDLEVF